MNDLLNSALKLARQGCPVFPVGRDKKPLLKDWPHQASLDEKQIQAWFAKEGPPNLALTTGEKSGLFVLDVDGPAGLESMRLLEERHGTMGRDCTAWTPSGGLHLYFGSSGFSVLGLL